MCDSRQPTDGADSEQQPESSTRARQVQDVRGRLYLARQDLARAERVLEAQQTSVNIAQVIVTNLEEQLATLEEPDGGNPA